MAPSRAVSTLAHQYHYDLLVQSERLTLIRAFAAAGHRSIAVKPAITRRWLAGERLGYARVYAAADLGYQGPPYSWVTMPDQFTLAALERLRQAGGPPLFAEVSLISSHAPWTPLPVLLDDWSAIGDGRIYERWLDERRSARGGLARPRADPPAIRPAPSTTCSPCWAPTPSASSTGGPS